MENINNIDHSNNGLITKIWGPHLWEALHSISFGFPNKPTTEQQINYMHFFKSLSNVLPCIYCRKSYQGFISSGETELSLDKFENRSTLTKWLFDLHEAVNKKLGYAYGVTYEDVVDKYESYRAKCVHNEKGCIMPMNLKASSYKKAGRHDAPIIDEGLASKFINYAKKRNFDMEDIILTTKKFSKKTDARNKLCWTIINKMRIDAIPSVEKSGEYEGLPTMEELKLLSLLSTTISSCDFEKILEILSMKNLY